MKTKPKKPRFSKPESLNMTIESPTWGQLVSTAKAAIEALGGQRGAGNALSWEHYYTLTLLASLTLSEEKAAAFIFGSQYIS